MDNDTPEDFPRERFVETLPVKLTKKEVLSKSADLMTALDKRSALKDEKKATSAMFREEEKKIEAEIEELAASIKSGKEKRPVECFQRTRIADRMIDTIRCDTGDVVRSRPMTIDERQLALKDIELHQASGEGQTFHEKPGDNEDEEEPAEPEEEAEQEEEEGEAEELPAAAAPH
ncbi:MAG TPA: hypothetical protein VED01_03405 [Burkholderiales bacterium]|nr:hypothetical protein [Burkholderiales bacterium]